ncbi:hypothetical protein CMI37_36605 [Candidatus Pacearchaeota archaeon]|nr:hypothetical protein [Candidatus Pacearchaeota archaeon]
MVTPKRWSDKEGDGINIYLPPKFMKNEDKIRQLEKRIIELEKNSHPPVNWKELIQSNTARIEELENIKGEYEEPREHD